MTGRPSRATIAALAIVTTVAGGFWSTAFRGAVGIVGAADDPLASFLKYVAVMLPFYAVAVLGAVLLAGRAARRRGGGVRAGLAILLATAAVTIVGLAQITATAVLDYRAQREQISSMAGTHGIPASADPRCDAACVAVGRTFDTHRRAVGLAALVLLVSNGVLVPWTLAARGGRIWSDAPAGSPVPAGSAG